MRTAEIPVLLRKKRSSGGPLLTQTDLSVPASINGDTFTDWISLGSSGTLTRYKTDRGGGSAKIQATPLGGATLSLAPNNPSSGSAIPTFSWTTNYHVSAGGDDGPGSSAVADIVAINDNPGTKGLSVTVPATANKQTVRIIYGGYRWDAFGLGRNGPTQWVASLTDSSAGPITISKSDSVPIDQDWIVHYVEINFASNGAGSLNLLWGTDGTTAMPVVGVMVLV